MDNTNGSQNVFKKIDAFRPLLATFLDSAKKHLKDQSLLPGFINAHNQLLQIVSEFYTKQAEFDEQFYQSRITAIVKDEEMDRARAYAEGSISGVRDLRAQQQKLESQLFQQKTVSDTDRIINTLHEIELRKRILDMDPLQLTALMETRLAADVEDPILDACINGRSFQKVLPPDEEKRYLLIRAQARNPQLCEELSDVELINGLIKGMKSVAQEALKANS